MAIGILGLYIGKMFEQVKNRPQYIVDEKINWQLISKKFGDPVKLTAFPE